MHWVVLHRPVELAVLLEAGSSGHLGKRILNDSDSPRGWGFWARTVFGHVSGYATTARRGSASRCTT